MPTEVKVVYFDNAGKENTEAVLRIVKQRAQELGIKNVVVASTRGETAIRAVDVLKGLRVIIVRHVMGSREPNVQLLTEENRQIIESRGGVIVTAAHAFAGLSRALNNRYKMPGEGTIIADTLRTFGQGMKVACEIALMAADAGQVRTDEDIITISGSSGGADTALVLTPTNSHTFFNLKVKEILCKPRQF